MWFIIHRPMMMSVPIISVAAFIVILWEANWQWISISDSTTFFAHSIFGIVTIGLSIIQVSCFQLEAFYSTLTYYFHFSL